MRLFQILLAALFYLLIGTCYWYSKGWFSIQENRKKQYIEWVNKYGSKASRACVTLLIIYTIILIFQLLDQL